MLAGWRWRAGLGTRYIWKRFQHDAYGIMLAHCPQILQVLFASFMKRLKKKEKQVGAFFSRQFCFWVWRADVSNQLQSQVLFIHTLVFHCKFEQATEEHIVSILTQLFLNLSDVRYFRLLRKFQENDMEKAERLIELQASGPTRDHVAVADACRDSW